ncbi:hypothetical protein Anapl_02817 [Anas platyrhynchos]|uniref:Uncharacterized protein n=1 Tax=Anas platyrhynchos TaxID=8839 RepID=R0LHP6_ANAPL|nr:hypothetical protein Anapl_02817 [Anas platyrhynchos]
MLPGVGDACSGGGCPPALQPRARTTLSSVALGGPLQLGRAVPVPIPISCPIPIPTLLPACPTTVGSGEVLEEGSAEALCPLFATKGGTVPKGTVCCQGACAATHGPAASCTETLSGTRGARRSRRVVTPSHGPTVQWSSESDFHRNIGNRGSAKGKRGCCSGFNLSSHSVCSFQQQQQQNKWIKQPLYTKNYKECDRH